MADAVVAAKVGQKAPDGHYNVERMLKGGDRRQRAGFALRHLHESRGLTEADIMAGARRSTMNEPAAATVAVDKVRVF